MIGTSSKLNMKKRINWNFLLRLKIKFLCSFSARNFICFIFSSCSKKKLIQQRSLQTSDRPFMPNILMMPITKTVDKHDQYAVEWVHFLNILKKFPIRDCHFRMTSKAIKVETSQSSPSSEKEAWSPHVIASFRCNEGLLRLSGFKKRLASDLLSYWSTFSINS